MIGNKLDTILLITRDRLVRADVRPGRPAEVVAMHEETRPAVDDLPSLVETALRLGRTRPGRVWVLSTEVWTQTLNLAAETASRLSAEELARALAFESEPFSGVSGMDARIGFAELPAGAKDRVFWLCALPAAQLDQIEYVVHEAGGRLAAIGHPAGLGRPLAANDDGRSWQRIELWPGVVVFVAGAPDRQTVVRLSNADPRPGRWLADAERCQAQIAPAMHQELLHATSSVPLEDLKTGLCLSLADEETRRLFCRTWAEQLAARESALPLIKLPKRPMSAGKRQAVAVALALVALAACVGHYLVTESIYRRQVAEAAQLNRPIQRMQQLKKEAETNLAKSKKLKEECQKLKTDVDYCQHVMQSQRRRLAALMTLLAQQNTGQIVLEKIDATTDGIVLRGMCLNLQAADGLAGRLASTLDPLGWQVQLPNKQGHGALVGGGPWQFEMQLREAAVTPAANRSPAGATASVAPRHAEN